MYNTFFFFFEIGWILNAVSIRNMHAVEKENAKTVRRRFRNPKISATEMRPTADGRFAGGNFVRLAAAAIGLRVIPPNGLRIGSFKLGKNQPWTNSIILRCWRNRLLTRKEEKMAPTRVQYDSSTNAACKRNIKLLLLLFPRVCGVCFSFPSPKHRRARSTWPYEIVIWPFYTNARGRKKEKQNTRE